MTSLLQGTRVLDLSERSPSAAIAGMLLAAYGAEVIRVEPLGGDPLRALELWQRTGSRSAWQDLQSASTATPIIPEPSKPH